MSEAPDKESKTEQATDKRFEDSIQKGQSPISREAVLAVSFLVTWFATATLSGNAALVLVGELSLLLQNVADIRLTSSSDAQALLWVMGIESGRAIGPAVLLLAGTGVLASIAQSRKFVTLARLAPDMSRVSPFAGLKRIVGKSNLQEFAKSMAKLVIVFVIATLVIRGRWPDIVELMGRDASAIGGSFVAGAAKIFAVATLAMLFLAGLDILLGRFVWRQGLRMTRQEVKDEAKQSDGDRALMARRRSIALRRIRKQLKAAVPRATLVLANPTHYAVALRYVPSEGGAPVVVAKGLDHIALSIRRIAEEHKIPVFEDKPLARSMHDSVSVDRPIPVEFYKAVANIMIILHRRGLRK